MPGGTFAGGSFYYGTPAKSGSLFALHTDTLSFIGIDNIHDGRSLQHSSRKYTFVTLQKQSVAVNANNNFKSTCTSSRESVNYLRS